MSQEVATPILYGSETEWPIWVETLRGEQGQIEHSGLSLLLRNCLGEGVTALGYGSNMFLSNGARFYIDYGDLAEYSTPECDTVEGAVLAEFAGEEFITRAMRRARESSDNGGAIEQYAVHKRVLSEGEAVSADDHLNALEYRMGFRSTGYHRNFGIRRRENGVNISKESLRLWGLHCATRSLYMGAGGIVSYSPDDTRYITHQKSFFLSEGYSSATTHQRPVVNLRNEPLAGNDDWVRVHDTSGDANISPRAMKMGFGTGGLVLRMIDAGMSAPFELRSDTEDDDLPRLATLTAVSGLEQNLYQFADGKRLSALNVQEGLYEMAMELSGRVELPRGERAVLQQWGTIIEVLQSSASLKMLTALGVDWAAKQFFLERFQANNGIDQGDWSATRLKRKEFAYDLLASSKSTIFKELDNERRQQAEDSKAWGVTLRNKLWAEDMPQAGDVEDALQLAPTGGRARRRGAFIAKHGFGNTSAMNESFDAIDWDQARVNDKKTRWPLFDVEPAA